MRSLSGLPGPTTAQLAAPIEGAYAHDKEQRDDFSALNFTLNTTTLYPCHMRHYWECHRADTACRGASQPV